MNTTRDLCTAAREALRLDREQQAIQIEQNRLQRIRKDREDLKKIVGEEFFYQCQRTDHAFPWLICGEHFVLERYDDGVPYLRTDTFGYGNVNIAYVNNLVSLGLALERMSEFKKTVSEIAQNEPPWYRRFCTWVLHGKQS
jgi:hypothetical protein